MLRQIGEAIVQCFSVSGIKFYFSVPLMDKAAHAVQFALVDPFGIVEKFLVKVASIGTLKSGKSAFAISPSLAHASSSVEPIRILLFRFLLRNVRSVRFCSVSR